MIPQPGDIILVRSPNWIGSVIRVFTRAQGEAPTVINHCALMVSDTDLVETGARMFRANFHAQYGNRKGVWIARKADLTLEQRDIIVAKALDYLGRRYGWIKIVAHGLDHLVFGDRYVMRRLCRFDNYPICSWIVAYSYAKAGINFGVPAWAAAPDSIDDWIRSHPEWVVTAF